MRCFAKILRYLSIPLLLVLSSVLAVSLFDVCQGLAGKEIKIFLISLLPWCLVFCKWRLAPVYVFGHEMTHWLAAKLTFHQTGRISVGRSKGYVEVSKPTGFITLAPYFFPLYFIVLSGLMVICQPWLQAKIPNYAPVVTAILLAGALAYHFTLTCIALYHGQDDMKFWGTSFPLTLILFLNLMMI